MASASEPKRGERIDYEYLYKILLIGDASVGKSCLLLRYTDDTFSNKQTATIGVDFKIRTIDLDDKAIKLQLWDTAGQERFRTVVRSFYRGAHGVIVVYDVTDMESFNNVTRWFDEVARFSTHAVKILVGNKSDLQSERAVPTELGREVAKRYGIGFVETSALTSQNVEQAFITIAYLKIQNRATFQNQIIL
eukprot:CAMPEP_0183317604 /NCGR_PEP_ID=MMETSP0160_2-20130417/58402_1 /TAXON_ID=2839 ORGANISM="Odontella Sinensis, Strain Grunow 1884" /NCGR_SAMPLE_ID=MMETSP0160_2 /ASSEMBLY_ACC=CAM_ASM_000250 /LENGTH=191 /DNA_ID=CAMNT_0025483667 /DNA_START=166 /DNA_END=741 /DNA_ORIENTATION=-